MIRGFVFDMDGVLLNNAEFHIEAFRRFGQEMGLELTRDAIYHVFGRRNDEMLDYLLGRSLSPKEVRRYEIRKESLYRELIRPSIRQHVVPGLEPFLDRLRLDEVPCAVATSGPPENVAMVLDELGLRQQFQAVLTSREVQAGKPDPEVFLKACGGLGLSPADCMVVEDSPTGVTAAHRAGCRCIALTTTHSRETLEKLSPWRIAADFRELLDLPLGPASKS